VACARLHDGNRGRRERTVYDPPCLEGWKHAPGSVVVGREDGPELRDRRAHGPQVESALPIRRHVLDVLERAFRLSELVEHVP
jgi:hypothetical protein